MPAVKKSAAIKEAKGIKNSKAPSKKTSEKTIKYSDKSAGQPELLPIFENIKSMLKPYVKGTMVEQGGTGGTYGLVSKRAVEIDGRKRDEMWFAGLLVQKGYVGFYFMPVYTSEALKQVFKPELLKCLKGKSCFHIKKDDAEIMEQIKDALEAGYAVYKEKGWV